jgi:disulfide bond formation protein DsbB
MLGSLISFSLKCWLGLALVTAAAMLAIAHAFQTFGGLEPCHLCLQQRTVYWVAMPVALLGLAADRRGARGRFAFVFGWLLAGVFLVGTVIAVRQAGAEWKWWPGPEGCSGVHTVTAEDLARLMRGIKGPAPRCDVAAWRFLGLSMAGWNALISAKLTGWSVAFGLWRRKSG